MPSFKEGFNSEEAEVLALMLVELIQYDDDRELILAIQAEFKNKHLPNAIKHSPKIIQTWRKNFTMIQDALKENQYSSLPEDVKNFALLIYTLTQERIVDSEYYQIMAKSNPIEPMIENLRKIHANHEGFLANKIFHELILDVPRIKPRATSAASSREDDKFMGEAVASVRTETSSSTSIAYSAARQIKEYIEEPPEEKDVVETREIKKEIVNFLKDLIAGATKKDLEDFFDIHAFLTRHPHKTSELKLTAEDQAIEEIRRHYHNFYDSFKKAGETDIQSLRKKLFAKLKLHYRFYQEIFNRIEFHKENLKEISAGSDFSVTADQYYLRLHVEPDAYPMTRDIIRDIDQDASVRYARHYMSNPHDLQGQVEACNKLRELLPKTSNLLSEISQLENYLQQMQQMIEEYKRKTTSCVRTPNAQRFEAINMMNQVMAKAFFDLNNKILHSRFGAFEAKEPSDAISQQFIQKLIRIKDFARQHHVRHSLFSCVTDSRFSKGMDQLLKKINVGQEPIVDEITLYKETGESSLQQPLLLEGLPAFRM